MFHVIDDEEMVCDLTTEILKSAGYNAVCYLNPVEYVEYAYSEHFMPPLAIFTDLSMPGMSGHELIDEIQKKFPKQKIVTISGYDHDVSTHNNRVCHSLTKPFSPESLIDIADAIVRCEKEGGDSVNTTCKTMKGVPDSAQWLCPLSCFECEGKQQN